MYDQLRNILIFLGAIFFAVLSTILCFIDTGNEILQYVAYVVYVLAALFVTAASWLTIRFFRRSSMKQWLIDLTRRSSVGARILDDYAFRTMVTGYSSLAVNSFFALTKVAAGWYYSSVWLFALAFYYLILCVTKALVLRRGRKRISGETSKERLCREWKIYRMCGVLLACMTLTLQGIIILIIEQSNTFTYHGTLIFAVALYDFYCMISSILYMSKTRKQHTPLVVSVKTISFATSLVAMLTLQTAMFASFSSGQNTDWQKIMNILTGTAVCAILIIWSAFMVRRSEKELKKLREEER